MNAEQLIDTYLVEAGGVISLAKDFVKKNRDEIKKATDLDKYLADRHGEMSLKQDMRDKSLERFMRAVKRELASDKKTEVVGPIKPRKRSLAQKQGARKGGRTRSRKSYLEGFGAIYYEYFGRPSDDDELE